MSTKKKSYLMVKCLKHSLCISNKTWMLATPTSRTFYGEVLANEVIRKLNKKLKNWKGKNKYLWVI